MYGCTHPVVGGIARADVCHRAGFRWRAWIGKEGVMMASTAQRGYAGMRGEGVACSLQVMHGA